MPVPTQILDGTPAYGTTSITIGGQTYIVNSETITPNWQSTENYNANGTRNQKRWTRISYTYTAELQLTNVGQSRPTPGTTFTRTIPNEASVVTFVVVETPFEADNQPGSIRVCNITAEEVKNSITTA